MQFTRTRVVLALISALSLGSAPMRAQVAPNDTTGSGGTPANPAEKPVSTGFSDESAIVLDPFTVSAEHEGYQAVDTLGGARIRTKLADTPSSLSVVTGKLLSDLGVNDAQGLLVYTNNTEVAGLGGNFSGVVTRGSGISVSGPAEGQRLVNPAAVTRARGLTAMDNTRNYFPSDIPWDGFNISRVDISRGPNSFLFGVGSPSGISNVSTNDALFSTRGKFEARFTNTGSSREVLDYNQVLLPAQLAMRVALMNDDAQFEQDPAFNHSKRAYGAVRFDPEFLRSKTTHTKIQANFEHGVVNSNNPRTLPPLDYITGYLNDPRASATGYNPWLYQQHDSGSDPASSYWSGHGSLGNEYEWGNAPHYYWDATTGSLLRAGQAGFSAPTSANYGAGAAGLNNIYHVHTKGFSDYAKTVNYFDPNAYKGAYNGTVTYLDQTLSDPSVFDFYHKLIDGTNKREWQRWNAYNVNVVQSLFSDRLVIQAVADHQEYTDGQEGVLNSRTPVLVLDLDTHLLTYPTWLSQAQANPDAGRPAVFGSYGNGSENTSTRSNYQVTAAWNLDFTRDFGSDGLLGRILGRHDLTGLGGQYTREQSQNSYKMYGVDPAWAATYNSGTKLSDSGLTWQAYVGPSLLGKKAAGADLSNLTVSIDPTEYLLSSYQKVWSAGTSVDPTSPWNITLPNGSPLALTQADNPANYRGYVGVPTTILNSKDNMDMLRTASSMREQRITSRAFLYQGHFWDDTVIPSFGWRRDTTRQRGNVAVQDATTGLFRKIESITDEGIKATTTSKSYGVALHLPKAIKKNLPEGTDVSVYYFHGANETPRVRYGIDGSQLPNESGRTDDYSIQIDALQGRATVRLTYFKTVDNNAQASYGQPLGTNGWMIDSLPAWTVTMAASALAVQERGAANVPSDLAGNGWLWQWAVDHPDVAQQIATALKTDFATMFPQSYWDQYGSNIDMAAVKAGDWLHVLKNQPVPYPWLSVANHVIHGEYPTIDQSIESKGYELEATFRPVKNWDITFNASRATARQTALGEAASRYLNGMARIWLDTAVGKTAIWGGYTDYGAAKTMFMQNLWAPYLTQVALTGSDQPEWRKLKFNVITNYTFDHGVAKGLSVGGAVRWQDKSILGYGVHEATVYGEKAWITDVDQPIYGPTDSHFDAWIGYSHRLTKRIDWRIQLNLVNLGEKMRLVPIAVQPDGSVAQERIVNGQGASLTTTFNF